MKKDWERKMIKKFTINIEDADGPVQMNIMDNDSGTGMRVVGAKGSPHKRLVAQLHVTREEMISLREDIGSMLGIKTPDVEKDMLEFVRLLGEYGSSFSELFGNDGKLMRIYSKYKDGTEEE
jgi:hypothetical protein